MAIETPSPLSAIVASAILSAICVAVTVLRFWARRLQKAKLMLDDWLTLPALLLAVGMGAAMITGVRRKAFAYPTPFIDPAHPPASSDNPIVLSAQLEWAILLMQIPHLGFVKLSFVFLFRRIFLIGGSSTFRIASLAMIILIILWTVSFFLITLFACRGNFSALWTSVETLLTMCIATLPAGLGFSLSDFIMDLMIMAIPVPMVWRLKMSNNRKIAVTAVFALGSVAVVASLIRVLTFYETKAVVFKSDVDGNLVITKELFWSVIESDLASIAVCLPVLHSLFRRVSRGAVIHSVRSITSIGSSLIGLRRSRSSNTTTAGTRNDNDSTASHAQMFPSYLQPTTVETYVMRDRSEISDDHNVPQGEILVRNTVTQSQCAV